MSYTIPVNSFEDVTIMVIQGLKKRFLEGPEEFRTARVSVLKTEGTAPVKPEFEVVVSIPASTDLYGSNLIREHALSVGIYAPDYATANRLASVTSDFIQSLPALGKIQYVSIEANGLHIDNEGPEQVRQITANIRTKSNKTTLYQGE